MNLILGIIVLLVLVIVFGNQFIALFSTETVTCKNSIFMASNAKILGQSLFAVNCLPKLVQIYDDHYSINGINEKMEINDSLVSEFDLRVPIQGQNIVNEIFARELYSCYDTAFTGTKHPFDAAVIEKYNAILCSRITFSTTPREISGLLIYLTENSPPENEELYANYILREFPYEQRKDNNLITITKFNDEEKFVPFVIYTNCEPNDYNHKMETVSSLDQNFRIKSQRTYYILMIYIYPTLKSETIKSYLLLTDDSCITSSEFNMINLLN